MHPYVHAAATPEKAAYIMADGDHVFVMTPTG
jgi:hypothetical protein